MRAARESPASERILDVAERLAQTRGFNGFSYADIAEELGVTKASLHYHFASKSELGRALLVRYQVVFGRALEVIDQDCTHSMEKLRRYVALYDRVINDDRMCLCGMFAAEYATLPQPMQEELRRFFDANEEWLTAVLQDGIRSGELRFRDPPRERARIFLGALEGAMLVARSYNDDRRFRAAGERLLQHLRSSDGPPSRTRKAPARERHAPNERPRKTPSGRKRH